MGEQSASEVVMDVENGDVLALASVPSYDPNLFNVGLTTKQWNDLVNDPLHTLSNKAIPSQYAPGETFQLGVARAALKAGLRPEPTELCPGYMTVGRATAHRWKE